MEVLFKFLNSLNNFAKYFDARWIFNNIGHISGQKLYFIDLIFALFLTIKFRNHKQLKSSNSPYNHYGFSVSNITTTKKTKKYQRFNKKYFI